MKPSLVNWREWSDAAFAEARAQDKPVLLLVEQFWCGMCRLLYDIAWSEPALAEVVEALFVPIRVDAARRPDIDVRFRMGGWPTIAFLTPDARPITGTDFAPPDVLLNAFQGVVRLYRTGREDISQRVEALEEAREAAIATRSDPERAPSPWMVSRIIQTLKEAVDNDFGGFGDPPKSPRFDILEFLIAVYRRLQDDSMLDMVTDTLDGMAQNGLYDWEDGGFFRVSDEPDWSSPRFEKLLSDQARHIELYLWAYQVTGTLEYAETVEGVVGYCQRMLHDPVTGVFHNSQAAEASYYTLPGEDRLRSTPPPVDSTVFLHSNLRMARALLAAGSVMDNASWVDMGRRCADAVLHGLFPDGAFAYRYDDGTPRVQGLLTDQVEAGSALLELFQATGDSSYLSRALDLAWLIDERLADPRQPGYFDCEDPLGFGTPSLKDKVLEDNTGIATFYARLAHLSGQEVWMVRARAALAGFTGLWEKLGLAGASYGLGLLEVFAEPVMVTLSGRSRDELVGFAAAALSAKEPMVLLNWRMDVDDEASADVRRADGQTAVVLQTGELIAEIRRAVTSLPQAANVNQA